MEIIDELHRDGITVILITHFMDEAVRADRLVILDQGQVRMDGTPAEIFSREEELQELGLDVPLAVDMAQRLRKRGIPVPENIITIESLVEYICQ